MALFSSSVGHALTISVVEVLPGDGSESLLLKVLLQNPVELCLLWHARRVGHQDLGGCINIEQLQHFHIALRVRELHKMQRRRKKKNSCFSCHAILCREPLDVKAQERRGRRRRTKDLACDKVHSEVRRSKAQMPTSPRPLTPRPSIKATT